MKKKLTASLMAQRAVKKQVRLEKEAFFNSVKQLSQRIQIQNSAANSLKEFGKNIAEDNANLAKDQTFFQTNLKSNRNPILSKKLDRNMVAPSSETMESFSLNFKHITEVLKQLEKSDVFRDVSLWSAFITFSTLCPDPLPVIVLKVSTVGPYLA